MQFLRGATPNSSWDANWESVTSHTSTALTLFQGLWLHHSSSSPGSPPPNPPERAQWKESLDFAHQHYTGRVLPASPHNQISLRGLQWKPEADLRFYTWTEVRKLNAWWWKSCLTDFSKSFSAAFFNAGISYSSTKDQFSWYRDPQFFFHPVQS